MGIKSIPAGLLRCESPYSFKSTTFYSKIYFTKYLFNTSEIISSVGANRNAKRAALVHLSFNVIGAAIWLVGFCIVKAVFAPALLTESASLFGIAVFHSVISLANVIMMFPFTDKLTSHHLSEEESVKATEYMKLIGDYERIADHAVNILESAEEKKSKGVTFSENAVAEYKMICDAVIEILELSFRAFSEEDMRSARNTESLKQVIDKLKEDLRTRHFVRLQNRECSVAAGFIWSDLLTNLERVSDHCSNISGCVLDTEDRSMNMHDNQRTVRNSEEEYMLQYNMYSAKYSN